MDSLWTDFVARLFPVAFLSFPLFSGPSVAVNRSLAYTTAPSQLSVILAGVMP